VPNLPRAYTARALLLLIQPYKIMFLDWVVDCGLRPLCYFAPFELCSCKLYPLNVFDRDYFV
jgi:hypothetical protein